MPILFILKAIPGVTIEQHELDTYPPEHFYQVQKNAWMDARTWSFYLDRVPEYVNHRDCCRLIYFLARPVIVTD